MEGRWIGRNLAPQGRVGDTSKGGGKQKQKGKVTEWGMEKTRAMVGSGGGSNSRHPSSKGRQRPTVFLGTVKDNRLFAAGCCCCWTQSIYLELDLGISKRWSQYLKGSCKTHILTNTPKTPLSSIQWESQSAVFDRKSHNIDQQQQYTRCLNSNSKALQIDWSMLWKQILLMMTLKLKLFE